MVYNVRARADKYSDTVERLMRSALREAGERPPVIEVSATVPQLAAASAACGVNLLDWFPARAA